MGQSRLNVSNSSHIVENNNTSNKLSNSIRMREHVPLSFTARTITRAPLGGTRQAPNVQSSIDGISTRSLDPTYESVVTMSTSPIDDISLSASLADQSEADSIISMQSSVSHSHPSSINVDQWHELVDLARGSLAQWYM